VTPTEKMGTCLGWTDTPLEPVEMVVGRVDAWPAEEGREDEGSEDICSFSLPKTRPIDVGGGMVA
jgi:hypothetical protein